MSVASAIPRHLQDQQSTRHITPENQPTQSDVTSEYIQSSPIITNYPITSFQPIVEPHLELAADLNKRLILLKDQVKEPIDVFVPTHIESDIRKRTWDFEKGDTDKQLLMRHAFQFDGRSKGLALTIEQFSLHTGMMPQRLASSVVWRHVRTGAGNPDRMMQIVDCIHNDLIIAMIDGNAAYRMCHDVKFSSDMKAFHDSQTKMPGQYLMQFARRPIGVSDENCPNTQSTQASLIYDDPNAGGYLSPNELCKLIKCVERYLEPTKWSYAREVDNIWNDNKDEHPDAHYKDKWWGHKPGSKAGSPPTYNDPYRRFYDKKSAEKALEWIAFLKVNFKDRLHLLSDEECDRILQWSPLEIGYGIDIYKRIDEHSNYNQSNRLFVFQNSLITHTFDPKKTFFKTYKFAVNRLSDPKDAFEEACTSDVGVTMIAKSHWFDGGLNPDLGAGGGVKASNLQLPNVQANLRESWSYHHADNSLFHTNLLKDEEHLRFLRDHQKTRNIANNRESRVASARDILIDRVDDIEDDLAFINKTIKSESIIKQLAELKAKREQLETTWELNDE